MKNIIILISLFSFTCFAQTPLELYQHLHKKQTTPLPEEPAPPEDPPPVVDCLLPGEISHNLERFIEKSTCYHWEYNKKMKEALRISGVKIQTDFLFQVSEYPVGALFPTDYMLYFSTNDQACELSYSVYDIIENTGTDPIANCYLIPKD